MANQFVVQLKNEPGAMANLAEALATRGVDLRAIGGGSIGDSGHVIMTTNEDAATKAVLEAGGYTYVEGESLLVEVDDPGREDDYAGALEAAGFELRVREPRHRMFRTPVRDVHVHVWPAGCSESADYLTLRDWLRTHAEDRRLYESAKRALSGCHWRDMNYYAEAKSPVIAEIMARARGSRSP